MHPAIINTANFLCHTLDKVEYRDILDEVLTWERIPGGATPYRFAAQVRQLILNPRDILNV